MPVLDEAAYNAKRSDEVTIGIATDVKAASTSTSPIALSLSNGHKKTVVPSTNALIDLLDLSVEDAPGPSQSPGDFLQDLLSVTAMPPSSPNATNGMHGYSMRIT